MQAYEKVFDEWDIDLTEGQEKEFRKERFMPVWEKFSKGQETFSIKDSVPFMRDLMRMSQEDKMNINEVSEDQQVDSHLDRIIENTIPESSIQDEV